MIAVELIFFIYAFLLFANLTATWLCLRKWGAAIMHPTNVAAVLTGILYVGPIALGYQADGSSLLVVFLALIALTLSNLTCHMRSYMHVHRVIPAQRPNADELIIPVMMLTVVVTWLYFVFIFTKFDIREFARYYAKSRIGTSWVYILISFNHLVVLYWILTQRVRWYRPATILTITLSSGTLILQGTRGSYVLYVLIYLMWISVSRKPHFMLRLAVILALGILFISLATFFRYEGDLVRLGEYFVAGVFSDFDNIKHLNYLNENIATIGYQYGRTVYDIILFFIPRAIWPAKPVSHYTSRIIYPELFRDGRTTSFTIGMIGEAFLNFGIIGVLLAHFAVGLLFYKLYTHLIKAVARGQALKAYLYTVILSWGSYYFVFQGIMTRATANLILLLVLFRLFIWVSRHLYPLLRLFGLSNCLSYLLLPEKNRFKSTKYT